MANVSPGSLPIEVHGLTKRYGKNTVVSDLSFVAQPGRVTGFLGPNPSRRHDRIESGEALRVATRS